MLPPDPDDPPKTFFEAASDEGLLPRPLKKPPLPPNILPLPLVVFGFISALPPNTEDEVVVVVAFSEPLKELPPKIDVDEVAVVFRENPLRGEAVRVKRRIVPDCVRRVRLFCIALGSSFGGL